MKLCEERKKQQPTRHLRVLTRLQYRLTAPTISKLSIVSELACRTALALQNIKQMRISCFVDIYAPVRNVMILTYQVEVHTARLYAIYL